MFQILFWYKKKIPQTKVQLDVHKFQFFFIVRFSCQFQLIALKLWM